METKAPKRRFEVKLTISGDEWPDVLTQLDHAVMLLADRGPGCISCAGGLTAGHMIDVRFDPTMTAGRYREELSLYLKAARAGRPSYDRPGRGQGDQ